MGQKKGYPWKRKLAWAIGLGTWYAFTGPSAEEQFAEKEYPIPEEFKAI